MAMQLNPVNWFEVPVTDLARAKAFYTATLGYEFHDVEMGPAKMAFFPMEDGRLGAGGSLTQAEGWTPSHAGTLVYFPVADIEEALGRAEAAGGKTLTPKRSIGEHGHIAMIEDSEGNRIGLHTPPQGE